MYLIRGSVPLYSFIHSFIHLYIFLQQLKKSFLLLGARASGLYSAITVFNALNFSVMSPASDKGAS